jgi:dipeptidyl-peptidase-4
LALAALGALLLAAAAPIGAAPAPLTIEQIFAPEPLIGRLPASISWAPDGSRFLYTLPGGAGGPLDTHVYTVSTKRDAIFFRAKAEGKGARPVAEFVWSPDSKHLAYLDAGNVMVVDADGKDKHEIAKDADDPQWSPDSTRIGYIHANDVYAVNARGGGHVRYSFDGSDDQVNGDPDWVYSEELGMRHAFRWSPDSSHIAYLRFDQRPVTKYPIVDFLPLDNTVSTTRYPLAGEKNSIVTLRVAAPGGSTRTLYSTKSKDDYIAALGWTPDGLPTASILDRAQRNFRFTEFGKAPRVLLAEHDAQFLNVYDAGEPQWLPDKHTFLFLSERDGQFSLYRDDARTGKTIRLTEGYRVNAIAGVDAKNGFVFVNAAYPTRRDSTVLMLSLRGGQPRPLASGHGSHQFIMAANSHHYIRIDSTFDTPPSYSIGDTLHGDLQPFAQSKSLANMGFGSTELFQVDTKLGKLDAYMIKPPDFDPQKKYPVITYVYGGPAAPTTQDAWGGATYLYHQALAQRGFIVFSIDGPGSQISTAAAVRKLTNKLGPVSLAGQLAGVAYLKSLPYVDPARIGIWGWSFGGYETTYALTHSPGTWKVGVAVAPVTDWRFYDSIYTERYMGMPQTNAKAYDESSVIAAAGNLRDKLLISHGTSDDNVHMANTVSLIQAFIEHGKQIDFMIYPRKNHGIPGIPQRRHLFNHMLNYWEQNL